MCVHGQSTSDVIFRTPSRPASCGPTTTSIRYVDLADPAKHTPPYDEALVRRWLDEEKKSDGTPGNTGVAWKMSLADENDLVAFLKTL